jgi:hypothetical protein
MPWVKRRTEVHFTRRSRSEYQVRLRFGTEANDGTTSGAEKQTESLDLNYERPRENAAAAMQKRFFSGFKEEVALHTETQVNGR